MVHDMTDRTAAISIDVDTLASIYKGQGLTRPGGYTYVEFRSGMENLARFFEKWNIQTTLFMVGNDFQYAPNLPAIRAAQRGGHEIANHSMTHPQGFRWLSAPEKEREIESMSEICRQVTGRRPLGFRSPGWNIDDSAIPILKKAGYRYDSSVFPTALMPLMKFAHWRSMSRQPAPARTTMGQMNYLCAPLRPYKTSSRSLARRGEDGLIEFPLSVSPLLRLPFFATFLLFSGLDFNRLLYRRIRARGLPINFQMHLSDFVDYSLPELEGQMPASGTGTYLPQALHTPLAKKLAVFGAMLETIAADYQFITLAQWAERMEGAA